jgi:hypothetical protein
VSCLLYVCVSIRARHYDARTLGFARDLYDDAFVSETIRAIKDNRSSEFKYRYSYVYVYSHGVSVVSFHVLIFRDVCPYNITHTRMCPTSYPPPQHDCHPPHHASSIKHQPSSSSSSSSCIIILIPHSHASFSSYSCIIIIIIIHSHHHRLHHYCVV